MRHTHQITELFFELLRAGLWEKDIRLSLSGTIDFEELYRFSCEQSVEGLIIAGLEHITESDFDIQEALPLLGRSVQIEKRNVEMNLFIGSIVPGMREAGMNVLLTKGQGIAQCYERPLLRASGDIDLLLEKGSVKKAFAFLAPSAQKIYSEESYSLHNGMLIDSWTVELHGSLRCGLSRSMDTEIDEIQQDCFERDEIRIWRNGGTEVLLPSANNEILLVFTHILKHFYRGGIGLRQICDWCRILYKYHMDVDEKYLERRLQRMKILSEWKAFGAFAVEYLGMPCEAMPLYSSERRWKRKADYLVSFVLEVGNFGKKRNMSYFSKYPLLIRKSISMCRRLGDLSHHAIVFPLDSIRFLPLIMSNGFKAAVRTED